MTYLDTLIYIITITALSIGIFCIILHYCFHFIIARYNYYVYQRPFNLNNTKIKPINEIEIKTINEELRQSEMIEGVV